MPKSTTSLYATIMTQIASLTSAEQMSVFSGLRKRLHGSASIDLASVNKEVVEKRFSRGFSCPHCKSDNVHLNGPQNGRQRIRCLDCGKYSSEHTNTPLRGLHKPEQWIEFVECELMGFSLRKSAKHLGIALQTAWSWREKFHLALQRIAPADLRDILEADETYIRENQKGNRDIKHRDAYKRGSSASKRGISNEQACVVVLRDRYGSTRCQVAGFGPTSKTKADNLFAGALKDVTCLCSNANGAWRAFATGVGLELNQSKKVRTKGIYHIQNVNSFHSRLKDWLRGFKGVATKYLNGYAALFSFVDAKGSESTPMLAAKLIVEACLQATPERYCDLKAPELPHLT